MPRTSPKKTRIANQIYRDQYGLEARVKVAGKVTVKRFGPETPLSTVQRWQLDARDDRTRAPLEGSTSPTATPAPRGAAFETRLEAFFATIAARVSYPADRSHLRAWLCAVGADGEMLGKKDPATITTRDLNVVIMTWRIPPLSTGQPLAVRRITVTGFRRGGKGIDAYTRKTPGTSSAVVVAARTVRHRCRVLREFFVTEGLRTNAIDHANIPAIERGIPMGVDLETIRTVAHALAQTDWHDTYGRYLVLVATGQRPTQLMQAQPTDVQLETRLWVVRGAKGAPAHTITLNTDMVKAWRVFIKAKAWGVYDTSLHAKRLRLCGWPAGVRPYNARHAVIQDALQHFDVRLDDAQGLAGHTMAETTRRFYGPLAIDRQRHVSDQIDGRLKGVFGPRLVPKKKGGV